MTSDQHQPMTTTPAPRLGIWAGRIFVASLAPIAVFGSRFAGNIILSRLLAPDEFGTAIAISAVLALGGLVTDVALDRFVVIEGSTLALSTAHLLYVADSIFLALALIVTAPATAALFGVANFAGSFGLAAGLSAIGGFAHLGIKQIWRNHKYGPESVAQVLANLTALAALFLAAYVLRNHRAIIVGSAVQTVVYVTLSHVLARTPYKLRFDKPMLRQALSFGLPLTLNGIGLAIMSSARPGLGWLLVRGKGIGRLRRSFQHERGADIIDTERIWRPRLVVYSIRRSGSIRTFGALSLIIEILRDSDQPLCILDGARSRHTNTVNFWRHVHRKPGGTCALHRDCLLPTSARWRTNDASARERSNQAARAFKLVSRSGTYDRIWLYSYTATLGIDAHWDSNW